MSDSKKITTVYVNEHLLKMAKLQDINVSTVLEEALTIKLNVSKGFEELKEKHEKLKQELDIVNETLKKYEVAESPLFKKSVQEEVNRLAKIGLKNDLWRKFLSGTCDTIRNKCGTSISILDLETKVVNRLVELKKTQTTT